MFSPLPFSWQRRFNSADMVLDCDDSTASIGQGSSGGGSTTTSPKNGDFQVLHQSLVQQRLEMQRAKATMASTLQRLGEHHVRNHEYDDAMNAFTEALHETRSVCSASAPHIEAAEYCGESSSLLQVNPSSSYGGSIALCSTVDSEMTSLHQKGQDDLIAILSSMGNVHSLRGEHAEAMRYYTEVMSIRASRSSTSKNGDDKTVVSTTCSTSSSGLWGGDGDNSTIMTELNEDVKALDDLFRCISFRKGEVRGVGIGDKSGAAAAGKSPKDGDESKRSKRKQRSKGGTEDNRRRRRRGRLENQLPPLSSFWKQKSDVRQEEESPRSPSPAPRSRDDVCLNDPSRKELSDAMNVYRSVIDTYTGQNLERHENEYLDFVNKMNVIRQDDEDDGDCDQATPRPSRAKELRLALNVYECTLSAQRDMTVPSPPMSPAFDQPITDISSLSRSQQAAINVASTLITMGSLHYKLNNVEDELLMYREARSVYQDALGPNHPFVAGTIKNIGMVLAERGEFDTAMEHFSEAKKIYEFVSSGEEGMSRDIASALSCIGNVQNRQGNLDEALGMYKEALGMYRTISKREEESGNSSTSSIKDVTSTLKVLGMVHAKRGDLDEAMDCFQEAMNLLRSAFSDNNGGGAVASILTRIAGIWYKKGQYDDAMSRYQEAHDLTVETIGTTEHPDVAGILHYIGGIHHKRDMYVEAMKCYKDAVRIYHATLGPDNPAVATTLVCVGNIHYKKKNLDNAMTFYKEALRLNRTAYGPSHPDVAPTLKSIGMIHTKKGEFDEAMAVFQEFLQMKEGMRGRLHPEVASSHKNLGNVHFKRGELADAEREYRQALSIYQQTLGEDHPDTIAAQSSIELIRESMSSRSRGGDNRSVGRIGNRQRSHIGLF